MDLKQIQIVGFVKRQIVSKKEHYREILDDCSNCDGVAYYKRILGVEKFLCETCYEELE